MSTAILNQTNNDRLTQHFKAEEFRCKDGTKEFLWAPELLAKQLEEMPESEPEKIAVVSYLDNGKVNPMALCEYLSRNNIVRVSKPGNDTVNVYHIDKKILREFNFKSETLAFLSERIIDHNKADIVNKIYENRNAVQDVFKLMPGVAFDFHRDTKDSVFIPFKNAVLKISAGNDPELISYDDSQIKYFAEA